MPDRKPLATENDRELFVPIYGTRLEPKPPPLVGAFELPLSGCCINAEWMSHILGTLAVLEWPDMWQGTPEEIEFALDQIKEIQDAMTCECGGGGDSVTRINIITSFRFQLRRAFESGGLDAIAPDRPDTFFDEDSGDTGDDIQRRSNALCNACLDYVNTVADDALAIARDIGLEVIGIAGPILYALGPLPAVVSVLVGADIAAATYLLFTDRGIRRDIACCMRDALIGQTITEDNFEASLTACGFSLPEPREVIRDLVEFGLDNQGNYLAFVSALGGYFAASSIAVLACPCDFWEHTFDFTIDEQGWTAWDPGIDTPSPGDDFPARAVYLANTGWIHDTDPNIEHIIAIQIAFASTEIVEVIMDVRHVHDPDIRYVCKMPDFDAADFSDEHIQDDAAPVIFTPEITSTGLFCRVSDEDTPLTPFGGHIRTITVKGTGVDPFP